MIRLGIVTDVDDPDSLRRVKVVSQDRGMSTSNWCARITNWDGDDLPVPPIGCTVVVARMLDDSADEVILGVLQTQTSNPIQPTKPGLLDWFSSIRANYQRLVSGFIKFLARESIELSVISSNQPQIQMSPDGMIRLSNRLGSITLLPTGYTIFTDPSGSWGMTTGGMILKHPTQVSIESPQLRWNGDQVAVVGGLDSDGDVTLS